MLPTPSTSHVDYDRVYEPAEDSYLLLDTLSSSKESTFLRTRFPTTSPSPLVLEVGTGSGVVLAFATAHAHHIFGREDIVSVGTDVNAFACSATKQTVINAVNEPKASAGAFLGCLVGDLGSSLRLNCVDVLIFNPPYVPTEELPAQPRDLVDGAELPASAAFERDSHLLSLSYAGGADGMETTNRLISEIPSVLSDRGVAYVLLCAQNKPKSVAANISAWPGAWLAEEVGFSGKTAGWERLCILRIHRHPREK